MRLREAGEIAFLGALRQALAGGGPSVRVGPGDDAAVVDCPPGRSLVVSCDAAVEGRHFRRAWFSEPEIGARAVRSALSDLAAMGACPAAALLTLIVSPDEEVALAQALVEGAGAAAAELGAPLVGGETVGSAGPLTLDVLVAGFVRSGRELRRSGAQPQDVVAVSGTLGDSAAGLAALTAGLTGPEAEAVVRRYKVPEPRLALGALLTDCEGVHAAIDVSDGLLQDAGHVAEQSGVAIELFAEALPLSPAARVVARELGLDPLAWALSGGEDFELLITVSGPEYGRVQHRARRDCGIELLAIGQVSDGQGVSVRRLDGTSGQLPSTPGWDHFRCG
ncbi:MAG: thiamine-phosphate kinase [Armatimonadetes bacterium]|nr:thiamine-phosphate kinase [Armatimonadota bacterium]